MIITSSKYKRILIIMAFLSTVMPLSASANSLTYSNEENYYSMVLPDDWIQIPKSEMDQSFSDTMEHTAKDTKPPEFMAGFQPRSSTFYFEYPYLLVQKLKDSTNISEEQVADQIQNVDVKKVDEKFDILSNATIDHPSVDKVHHAVLYNFTTDVKGIGKVKCLSAMILGKTGITQLLFYAQINEYDSLLPSFNSIINSFKYDVGYEYSYQQKSFWNWENAIVKGIVFGAIAGLFGLFRTMGSNNTRKKAKEVSPLQLEDTEIVKE